MEQVGLRLAVLTMELPGELQHAPDVLASGGLDVRLAWRRTPAAALLAKLRKAY